MIFKQFINYIPFTLKRRVLFLIPLLSISGILEVASLALLIPLISLVLQPTKNSRFLECLGLNYFSDTQKVIIIFSIFLIVMIIKGVFVYWVSKFTFTTALKIKVFFQNSLFRQYLQRDFLSHLSSNSAQYLRNITTECHQIEGRFIMPGLTLLAEILPVLFVIVFLIYLNPLGVLIAFMIFLMTGLLIAKTTLSYLKAYGKEQIYSDGMQVKIAKEAFSSLKEIVIYKKEERISSIYNGYTHRSADLISNALSLGQIPKFVLEVVGLLTISLIAYISFSRGSSANEVLIELTVFMGAIVKLLPSANRIVMNIQSLAHAKPAIENMLNELKEDSFLKEGIEKFLISKLEEISLDNLSFKYPNNNNNNYILNKINFVIKRGEIIGIKGESGSGKSTFINLLLGLFDAVEGQLKINNIDIKTCKDAWQNIIAYVPQEVVLFDDTLRNNIIFYQDDILDDSIKDILRKIKLEDFLNKLDMSIGEGGCSLSGGQKQRIGIARALVRNPQFIVFDEATSSLDNNTEYEINKLIKEISKEITVLIIAHKNSAFEICDKVYIIKDNNLELEVLRA